MLNSSHPLTKGGLQLLLQHQKRGQWERLQIGNEVNRRITGISRKVNLQHDMLFWVCLLQLVAAIIVYMIFKYTEGSGLMYRMGFNWPLFIQGTVEQKMHLKQRAKDDFISRDFQGQEEPLKEQKRKAYTCVERKWSRKMAPSWEQTGRNKVRNCLVMSWKSLWGVLILKQKKKNK